ncbi:hypothetical protein TRFO_11844 [Tritrichomonas foetus]|uniref:Uncharacterized protein n=1 Tax=Tritrichomonas foetus TaxID=1144522 RepID=A0A1J4J6Y6_9EUKA|nr:hypothetical protein TRFO_11844 [Tritrichomonas foetus]|eukprot:OHS93419.1 hypothetical protein TRFO_11844 [Tritrichomonas foetus]
MKWQSLIKILLTKSQKVKTCIMAFFCEELDFYNPLWSLKNNCHIFNLVNFVSKFNLYLAISNVLLFRKMDSSNPLSAIFTDIEKYLANNEENLKKFRLLKADFEEHTKEDSDIFTQILELIQDNENLHSAFLEAKSLFGLTESPVDLISEFTSFFTKSLSESTDLIPRLIRITSLLVENFISFDFYSYFINQICPENSFGEYLQRIKVCLDSNQQQLKNKTLPNIKIDKDFIIERNPSLVTKLFVSIPFLFPEEAQQLSVLKCLKLYGLQFTPYLSAFTWLSSLNEFFAQQFELLVTQKKLSASEFIPSNVFSELLQNFTEMQIMWAFDPDFYNILKKQPKFVAKSALQLNNERILTKNKNLDKHVAKAAPYIAEMQSIKFFTTLKAAGVAIRSGQSIMSTIPEGVIEAVFGQNCQLDKNDKFYQVLFQKCYEYGAEATQNYISILKHNFSELNPSTPDGRTAFHKLMRPSTVLKNIVFSGAVLETPKSQILNLTFEVAHKTVSHFSNLTAKYEKLVNAIKNAGKFDVDDSAILAIYYFMELGRLISEVDSSKYDVVKKIPDLIFKEPSPLKDFEMEPIANVDIILKNFAQYLHKADEIQFYDRSSPTFHKDFVFHLDVGQNVVVSKGIVNSLIKS